MSTTGVLIASPIAVSVQEPVVPVALPLNLMVLEPVWQNGEPEPGLRHTRAVDWGVVILIVARMSLGPLLVNAMVRSWPAGSACASSLRLTSVIDVVGYVVSAVGVGPTLGRLVGDTLGLALALGLAEGDAVALALVAAERLGV
ncbi:MAG: hypothetical protein ACXWN2_10140, partial [Candidatus Limnocylindrales bacterium]